MKVICRISGMEINSSEHFKDEPTVVGEHPIFSVPTRQLLPKARKWSLGWYSPEEEKLLFLALLNATERVEWQVPANPSIGTINKYMESMVKFVGWYDAVKGQSLRLPDLRVTSHNFELLNIGIYLTACYECRTEWMSHTSRKHLQDLVEKEEYTLQKLMFSGKDTTEFSSLLWRWVRKVLNDKIKDIGPDKLKDWEEIFKTPANEKILAYDPDEIDDMQAFFAEELFNKDSYASGSGSSYSMKVIQHIAQLKAVREGGWKGLITTSVGGPANTFSIISDTDNSVRDEIVSNAPAREPKREDYPGKLGDWMRAKAAWTLAMLQARNNQTSSSGVL